MKTDPADGQQLAACVQYKKTSQVKHRASGIDKQAFINFCSVSRRGEVDESAIRKAVMDLPDHNSSRHSNRHSRIFRTCPRAECYRHTASDSLASAGASQLCSHP